MTMRYGVLLVLVAMPACNEVIDLDPLDETPPVEASVRPPPISGGTLLVTTDDVAVASDPDRDLVHVVDVAARSVRHTITLEPRDEPGRVIQGSGTLAHVVLRGFGGVATIDLADGTVLTRRAVCPDPRGITLDPAGPTLVVGCADGTLAHIDEASGDEILRETLEPDLRDVMLLDGVVWASRFRSAELVANVGTLARPTGSVHVPRVAWRTWTEGGLDPALGQGARMLMLHQQSDTRPIAIDGAPDDGGDVGGGGGDLPYGGGGVFCEPGITGPALTVFSEGGSGTIAFPGLPLTVDAATSPDGEWVALAVPGAAVGQASVVVTPLEEQCEVDLPADEGQGQVTAVAFAGDGTLVMQSREPAQLVIRSGSPTNGPLETVRLVGESRFDTGHEIFHRATESTLSCASCHPEAGDDGHVWLFTELGPRRTQPLDIGLQGTAPFHWDGDMHDLDMIMDEVLSHRMGGERQSAPRRESFSRWLFERELPPVRSQQDTTLVAEGTELFGTLGCTSCHAGARLMSNDTVTHNGQLLQVPSLRRVSLRPPFMHDGRAATLEDAVAEMIATTNPAREATDHDIEAIAAYLRTQ